MIDLHTHILPNIDDGAKTPQESVKLLHESYSQGISICVATPHIVVHNNAKIGEFLSKRAESIKELKNELLTAKCNHPNVLFGAEVLVDNDLSEYEDIKKLCIQGTNLLVVELSYTTYSKYYPEWLFSLSVQGISLILAHIERYPYFDRLHHNLEGTNITYQINAETLLSASGRGLAKRLYQAGHQVIASSDTHGIAYRKNYMLEAYKKMEKKDKPMADNIFNTYALQLLNS